MYTKCIKKLLDRLAAVFLLAIGFPLLALLAGCVRVFLGKPVLFIQDRPGKNGKIFRIFKFRTMTDKRDASGQLCDDKIRQTTFGKFLRKTSLDELPELWNVLRGDMSLVGPRPLLPEYLPLYSARQNRRHEVLPGITGWAQVNGRNGISWEQKLDYDVYYVEHVSFRLDLRILLLTVYKVFIREGINEKKGVTMSPFTGAQEVNSDNSRNNKE